MRNWEEDYQEVFYLLVLRGQVSALTLGCGEYENQLIGSSILTGKTLLARAVAGEAGVNFFSASGSEFDEMYASFFLISKYLSYMLKLFSF